MINHISVIKPLRKINQKILPYVFIAPACIILGVFLIYPTISALFLSLFKYSMLGKSIFVGISNYQKMFTDPVFQIVLQNTIYYLLITVPALLILGLILALIINNKIRGMNFFRAAYFYPMVCSMVGAAIAWKWIFSPSFGLLNYYLIKAHLISSSINWLGNPNTALLSIAIVGIWKAVGFHMVVLLAGLQTIPHDLYESAKIDGTNWWGDFRYITFPLLMPAVRVVLIVAIINSLKVFDEVYVLTSGGPVHSTRTLIYYLYQSAFEHLNMGYASAIGVIVFTLILVLSLTGLRLTQSNFEE